MSAVTISAIEGTRAPSRSADRYFVNAPVDALVIGGASVILYAIFRLKPELAASPSVASIAATLVWVCNYPHFASTNYRLYHSKAAIAQYPLTSVVTPLVMVVAVVGCYLSPHDIAPLFIKLYLLWSPYHFSGQTLGITMVYARRAGFVIDGWLRRSLTAFIFLTFAVQSAWAEVGRHVNPFYGVQYPTLDVPIWLPQLLTKVMWVSLAVTIALLMWKIANGGPRVPLIVVLPAFTQYIWFVATPAGQFSYMVPFFHSLQYLLIAWNVQLKEGLAERKQDPSVRYVWSESARWMAINIAGGYVLFWGLPHLGAHFGKPMVFSTAVMLAAIQVHHFFVDGVIWRLRNPAARSPLSSSLRAVAGRT
ncbi:MAG TPA: hypothetical protein VH761_00060 [Ilumatobacteraceae bacterium]|jgi:hypothetical protein